MSSLKKIPVTEKSLRQLKNNVYTFIVDVSSNKFKIRHQIEKYFNVKVEKIRISRKKPVSKNRRISKTSLEKKAFVFLQKGYSISDFNLTEELETTDTNDNSDLAKSTKEIETTDGVEKKEDLNEEIKE